MISYSIIVIACNIIALIYFMRQQSPVSHTIVMATGMGYGFAYGILAAVIFPGNLGNAIFISSVAALVTGVLLGKYAGDSGQIICMMEGLMAALMGAMLLVMLPDRTVFLAISLAALTALTIYFIRLMLNGNEKKLNNIQEVVLYSLMCLSIIFIFSTFPFSEYKEIPDEQTYVKNKYAFKNKSNVLAGRFADKFPCYFFAGRGGNCGKILSSRR